MPVQSFFKVVFMNFTACGLIYLKSVEIALKKSVDKSLRKPRKLNKTCKRWQKNPQFKSR